MSINNVLVVNLAPQLVFYFFIFIFIIFKINNFVIFLKEKKSNCLMKLMYLYDLPDYNQDINIYLLHLISKKYLKN